MKKEGGRGQQFYKVWTKEQSKRDALRKWIYAKKLEEKKERDETKRTASSEDRVDGSEVDRCEQKISELGKKMEKLQKEKHNLFLHLKQVLQEEKTKQQSLAIAKIQKEPKSAAAVSFQADSATNSRRITNPGPARMYNPQNAMAPSPPSYPHPPQMYGRPFPNQNRTPPRLNIRDGRRTSFEPRREGNWSAW